jgi:(5-formylfuran-3-yl)methyl phosphate synthase
MITISPHLLEATLGECYVIGMKVLVGPVSEQEASDLRETNAHILDMKNTTEGSYGAAKPSIIRTVAEIIKPSNKVLSATVGDLSDDVQAGTAGLAAYGAASAGADYLKCGLRTQNPERARDIMKCIKEACVDLERRIHVIAGGYADSKGESLRPEELLDVASDAGSDGVMLDTSLVAKASGERLFDAMTVDKLIEFTSEAKRRQLSVILAGSLSREDISSLLEINPDVVGIRGTVCKDGDRGKTIDPRLVNEFVRETEAIHV